MVVGRTDQCLRTGVFRKIAMIARHRMCRWREEDEGLYCPWEDNQYRCKDLCISLPVPPTQAMSAWTRWERGRNIKPQPLPFTSTGRDMSVSTLQSATSINVQRSSVSAEGKEAGVRYTCQSTHLAQSTYRAARFQFLTFNYLNKHARVRVSPQPLDLSGVPGKANFFVVSNAYGWFAAVTRSVTDGLR